MDKKCFLLISALFFTSAANSVFAQSEVLKRSLDSLKANNNLNQWLYTRLDYVYQNPQQRLNFLMETQKQSWRRPLSIEEKKSWFNLLINEGYYQLTTGKILESINSYEDAYTFYQQNQKKIAEEDVVEYTLKPLSNCYTRLGDYERALYLQQLTLNLLISQKKIAETASVLGNMAISYRSMGDLQKAIKSVTAALKVKNTHRQTVIFLKNIWADILYDQNQFLRADSLIRANIKEQKNINSETAYWLMGTYTTAGKINLALQEKQIAYRYFEKALQLINHHYPGSRLREKADLLSQQGLVKLQQKQAQKALYFFNRTLKTLKIMDNKGQLKPQKIYGDNRLMEVFEWKASAHILLKQPSKAYINIQLALLTADKIRNQFADDKTKERLQIYTKRIAETGIEILYRCYQSSHNENLLKKILDLAEQSKSRTLLDQMARNQQGLSTNKNKLFIRKQALERAIIYNQKQESEESGDVNSGNTEALKFDLALINKQIKKKYPLIDKSNYVAEASNNLKKNTQQHIIEYFFGQEAVYTIDIVEGRVNQVIKINSAKSVKEDIVHFTQTYFYNGPDAMINSPRDFFNASNAIYNTLLNGIEINKHQMLTIIPDGVLGYLSFEGLITKANYLPNISNWPFMIKNSCITYAFSLNTLNFKKPANQNKGFTGIFITHQQQNSKPLKAVVKEAQTLKKIIHGNYLINQDLNSHNLEQALGNCQIFHIGTHAFLSGKNQEPTLDVGNKKIFLFELATQKSMPALVFLSACRTADGLLADAEGIISLARGFNAMGTPTTIASLWNVNDAAAADITIGFYKHLLAGKPSNQALHLSKTDYLSQPQNSEIYYLPYYWDSLILMGTYQKIDVQSPTNWLMIMGLLLVTFLFVGIFLSYKIFWKFR